MSAAIETEQARRAERARQAIRQRNEIVVACKELGRRLEVARKSGIAPPTLVSDAALFVDAVHLYFAGGEG